MRIGIDLGGTKIAAGLVDDEHGGVVMRFLRQPTPVEKGSAAIIGAICDLACNLTDFAKNQGYKIDAAGIAVPELVDNDGKICSSWNFPLHGLNREISAALGGLPVVIDSDVRAAAHAEARFGSGAGRRCFVYVSLGTGMSYSFCLNGRPWHGANGFAIHFASSVLALPTEIQGLVRANVEDFASGKGMETSYRQRSGLELIEGVRSLEKMGAAGDVLALRILDEAGEVTGRLLAQMVNMLDPEIVVLGGGLGTSEGRYRAQCEHFMRENIWAERCRALPLLSAKLDEKAGVIGAALASKDFFKADFP